MPGHSISFVGPGYLEASVLAKGSAAHLVYVTWTPDPAREVYLPMLHVALDRIDPDWRPRMVAVDAEVCQAFAERYEVATIPTVLLFREGERKATFGPFMPQVALNEALERYGRPSADERMRAAVAAARQALADGEPPERVARILDDAREDEE